MFENEIMVAIANIVPTTEQIGGITLGLSLGMSPFTVLLISLTVNCLLFFPIYFGLTFMHNKFLYKIKLFEKYLQRIQKRGKPLVDKYGFLGLTLFIAIPTPLTGTYTASTLSWFLNLNWKKAFLAIALGSVIGALVIFFGYYGLYNILKTMF
ncbi:MAG: small multi-drug export protein [Candidatus Aenigmarchaeota archaeon]|nr:small multi-drug export protein [Candidatus Aenigmarchaeota archaeon]